MEWIVIISGAANLVGFFVSKQIERSIKNQKHVTTTDLSTNQRHSSKSTRNDSSEVSALKEKLRNLRNEAKELNSPDTFVQYAKVLREANEVERELKLQLESEGHGGDSEDLYKAMNALSGMVIPKMANSQSLQAKTYAMKFVLRIVVWVLLWLFFTWRTRTGKGTDLAIFDCTDVRPLGFMMSKHYQTCSAEDWQCASAPPQCTISTAFALFLCNSAYTALMS